MEMKFKEIDLLESRLDILPEHTLEEQREIKQSIMKDGQKVPVVVDQKGFVVDGKLRFEILRDLGKECKYTVEKFKTESDVIRYMLVANLQRRNLNTFQKIEAHVMLYNALSRQLQKEHKKGAGVKIANKIKALDIFAEEMKISARTIGSSFWLMKHAPLEILAQLRNGTISINKAWVCVSFHLPFIFSGTLDVTSF